MENKADITTFRQDNLPFTAFAAFADMRKNKQLCDVTVRVQDQSFAAHRVVVAGVIPYFRAVFTGRGEIKAETEEMGVDDLDPAALESLIDFAYSGEVEISLENVRSLLAAAQFLLLSQVRNACVEFLTERLRVDNVVQVRTLGQNLNNSNLVSNCDLYIRKNFEEISKCGDFLSLPCSCIKEIISQDDLNAASEELVLEAVINFVKVSPPDRHVVLPELLSQVRMIFLPVDSLMNLVASEELIRTSFPCRDLIDRVKDFHLSKGKLVCPSLKTEPRKISTCAVRKCSAIVNDDIYVVGYDNGSVYHCNFDHKKWDKVASKHSRDDFSFAAAASEKIYMFLERTILTFHPKANKWEVLESTHENIKADSVVSHENVIYCFDQSSGILVNIYCFDTRRNKWLPNISMRTDRIHSAATSLGDSVYVTGGVSRHPFWSNGVANVKKTVEKYNPSTKLWSEVSSMLTARHSHGCATLNGRIYVCGGSEKVFKDSFTDKAEVYDSLSDQWYFISSMSAEIKGFSLVSSNNRIYAIGGVKSVGAHMIMEMYDPEKKEWESTFRVPYREPCVVAVPGTVIETGS